MDSYTIAAKEIGRTRNSLLTVYKGICIWEYGRNSVFRVTPILPYASQTLVGLPGNKDGDRSGVRQSWTCVCVFQYEMSSCPCMCFNMRNVIPVFLLLPFPDFPSFNKITETTFLPQLPCRFSIQFAFIYKLFIICTNFQYEITLTLEPVINVNAVEDRSSIMRRVPDF